MSTASSNGKRSAARQLERNQMTNEKDFSDVSGALSGESLLDTPQNLIIFIRDQVKPVDLWFPRDWADQNLPTQRWLQNNGLSFSNSFTNTSMCSVSRSTFFTGKYPAQHEASLILSDFNNPVLDSQIQLNPDLPNLGNVLSGQGYDVAYFGKYHLSKTITLNNGETLYQNPADYGFQEWQGPDAGYNMEATTAGLVIAWTAVSIKLPE